jgi:hypothetical protein
MLVLSYRLPPERPDDLAAAVPSIRCAPYCSAGAELISASISSTIYLGFFVNMALALTPACTAVHGHHRQIRICCTRCMRGDVSEDGGHSFPFCPWHFDFTLNGVPKCPLRPEREHFRVHFLTLNADPLCVTLRFCYFRLADDLWQVGIHSASSFLANSFVRLRPAANTRSFRSLRRNLHFS